MSDDRSALISELTRAYRAPSVEAPPASSEAAEARADAARADAAALAAHIDHTALKPDTPEDTIREFCAEAKQYGFASVCVNPCYVPLAAAQLAATSVEVCTVIGFPLGATATAVKANEAEWAVRHGAGEVDMVINIGLLKTGATATVEDDIRTVVDAARARRDAPARATVKVILETALLTEREKIIACLLAQNAGADFVKTSTGFSSGGATFEDVALMREVVGETMGVKASGGVGHAEKAYAMLAHGATRIGASGSVAIMEGVESSRTS